MSYVILNYKLILSIPKLLLVLIWSLKEMTLVYLNLIQVSREAKNYKSRKNREKQNSKKQKQTSKKMPKTEKKYSPPK